MFINVKSIRYFLLRVSRLVAFSDESPLVAIAGVYLYDCLVLKCRYESLSYPQLQNGGLSYFTIESVYASSKLVIVY